MISNHVLLRMYAFFYLKSHVIPMRSNGVTFFFLLSYASLCLISRLSTRLVGELPQLNYTVASNSFLNFFDSSYQEFFYARYMVSASI